MKPVNVLFLVAITILLQGGLTYEIVGDLSALQDQYQTLTQLDSIDTSYDTSIATLLGKLDTLQHTPSLFNSTLDWYSPPTNILQHPPLRITIVVSSIEGMFLNSGIGTFYSSLSDFLLQRGHSVTILYADTAASDGPAFTRWSAQVARRGAKAVRLGAFPIHLRLSNLAQRSYQVYEYLKEHQLDFDVVHFPEWEGLGYYSMVAKNDHLAFVSKVLIVGIHGPWRWVKAANNPNLSSESKLQSATDLETDWMEKKSVEMSDMVWTPSSDIVDWLRTRGWGFPKSVYQMPYLPGRELSQLKVMTQAAEHEEEFVENINEIVFFGRLETRKGLELFADALDRLAVTRPEFAGTKITFLGRSSNIGNQSAPSYIDVRQVKGAWPFKINYISHKDRKAALEYLRESTRIAVIPSLVDNTPYTVYECLFANIPFIASNIKSIAAIIDSEDRSDALFELNPVSLANKLEDVLDNGARIIKSSLLVSQIESAWNGFYAKAHEILVQQKEANNNNNNNNDNNNPLVSVCITHYNRPHFLQYAIESIEAQEYKSFEVILIDDGSTTQEAKDYLESLVPIFAKKNGWQIIKSTNQYLGAARNKAVTYAKGDYIFFLDDDNLAMPNLLSAYVSVAQATNADVITAAHDVFVGEGEKERENVIGRWVPLGGSPLVGLFKNCFGDANFFVKRSVFNSLHGFTEDRGVGQEDHEFLAKLILKGHSLSVIPEPLLAYRMHNQSDQMIYTTDSLKNALRAHRPYRNLMEESGLEINYNAQGVVTSSPKSTSSPVADSMKLLAYSRANSKRESTCNLTVSSVSPASFPARQLTTLTFSTAVRDCTISFIKIGDYKCQLTSTTASSFSCQTTIPIPGNYPVSLLYAQETVFRDTLTRVTVNQFTDPNGATTSLFTLKFFREPGMFDEKELLTLLAAQTPNVPFSAYNLIDNSITEIYSNKREVVDSLHTCVISITSSNPTAMATYNLLQTTITKKPSVILPYRFSSISLNAVCSKEGVCSCTLNYVGVGCTTPARCPNDCFNRGICVDGNNGKLCQCHGGWAGSDCGSSLCPKDCSENGDCMMSQHGGNGTCSCYSGWNGPACDIPNCPGNCNGFPCSGGVCQCPTGVTSPDCEYDETNNTGGNIKDTKTNEKDHYDRNVFIAIFVTFGVLTAAAGGAIYYQHQKKSPQLDDD